MRSRLAFLVLTLSAAPAWADIDRPTGIYLLSDPSPVSSVTSLLAKPFVDGYTQRITWTALEPAPGVYDFSRVDSIVAVLRPLGKRFTLSILAAEVPADLSASAGDETLSVRIGPSPKLTVLPWNTAARVRWNALIAALATHPVPDDAAGGALVPLCSASSLYGLSAVPYGMNGIRDIGGYVRNHPLYHRDSLIAGVVRGQQIVVDAFPAKFAWLAFFRMSDDIASPAADVQLLDSLRARFWNGGGPPRLGLFEENFACTTPNSSFAFALEQEQNDTYIAFQALQPWVAPFSNAAATDPCLVMSVPGDRSSATSGPEVGMQYVYDTFHARYLELYKADLEHAAFADELGAFWMQLHGTTSVAAVDAPRAALAIRPNPASTRAEISFVLARPGRARIDVFDAAGRRVRTLVNEDLAAGTHRAAWDGRDALRRSVRPGLYLVRCGSAGRLESRTMVWR
jgi:hypothetical protein